MWHTRYSYCSRCYSLHDNAISPLKSTNRVTLHTVTRFWQAALLVAAAGSGDRTMTVAAATSDAGGPAAADNDARRARGSCGHEPSHTVYEQQQGTGCMEHELGAWMPLRTFSVVQSHPPPPPYERRWRAAYPTQILAAGPTCTAYKWTATRPPGRHQLIFVMWKEPRSPARS